MKAPYILLVGILLAFLSSSNAEEKDGSTPSNAELESLREIIDQAGYKSKLFFDNRIAIGFQEFVQFGSYSKGKKFREGDAFDKIDIKKETSEHRDSILKRRFILDKLEFKSNFEDVETKGLLAEVALPFRIVHEKKYERFTSTGVLSGRPHPLDATGNYSFLTKDGKLQRCIGNGQVLQVRNSNGVLYRAENTNSVLVLVLKGDISTLKQIARNPKDYSISIELTGLRSETPDTWGFYKETALEKENWDSEWLRYFWPPLLEDKQPDYFVIAHKSDNNDRIPEIAMATMVSLAVMDNKKGEIIGGYNLKSSGLNKGAIKTMPPATKVDLTKDQAKVVAAIEKEMILIPAGKFMMGSPESEKGRSIDEKQHSVTLTKPFYMGKYEVTQEQWEALMGNNPSIIKGAKLPVTNVSWEDCQEFIKKLNAKTGGGYRLPTEAEWEYACRAGTTTAYSLGDEISPRDANYYDSAIKKPVEVGDYKRNAFGIFDLHGNVWEWCEDWYGDYTAEEVTDPKGSATGDGKVMRGGSFSYNGYGVRSSNRSYSKPSDRVGYTGFRLARTADLKAGASLTVPKPSSTDLISANKNLLLSPFNEAKAKEAQKEVAKSLQKEVEEKADLGKEIKLELVLIPAGKFIMGSPPSEKTENLNLYDDEQQHKVTLTKPYYMGKYEVTQEQWESVMGNNPSETKGAKLPVTNVSWEDCQDFIKELNAKTNGGYRLPSESEWEYGCRAGTTTAYSFGDEITPLNANYSASKIGKPVSVGSYKPNAFGLYDMHGNVWEWCEDYYAGYPAEAVTDPKGPALRPGREHVLRGGSFKYWGGVARSSDRGHDVSRNPNSRNNYNGFRLAKTADIKADASLTVPKPDPAGVKPVVGNLLVVPFTEAKAKEAQKELAKVLQKEVEEKANLGKGVNLEMVLIPAGKFKMGSPESEKGLSTNEQQHEVTLTKPFYMGKHEVTQEQWEAVMGKNPSDTKGAKLPVTDVSWDDCQEFIKKLNASTMGGYRIPYEAEWEFACRAGTATAYSFGGEITPKDANYRDSNIGKPVAVGSYKPNAFGLYDMHGNVFEWCEDWYGNYTAGSATDPKGSATGESRVLRGGSFFNYDSNARSSFRNNLTPSNRLFFNGFRLARTP